MHGSDKKKVTLVGAGPVGSLLSVFLARRGFQVEVYERRPDMRREAVSAGRSINLAISTRGLKALAEIGLEKKILEQAVPMKGRMIHPVNGPLAFQPYGKDETQYINSISRGGLNQALMDEAEATGRVKIHFKSRVSGADFEKGELTIHDETTQETSRRAAPVVIGTDGSASAIRQAMVERRIPVFRSMLGHAIKSFNLARRRGEVHLEKNALHIWPRGTYMLIALPNQDGSFTVTLFLPFEGPLSFSSLRARKKRRRF